MTPDFATGDLGRILERLEVLADPAVVALAASLESHLAAATLVTGSPRYTVERVCGALPGIDGGAAAAWLTQIASAVLSLALEAQRPAVTEAEADPEVVVPGLTLTADAVALGLPLWLVDLCRDAAMTWGRRLTLTTIDADVVHGQWDPRSGTIALVLGHRRDYAAVLAHELAHVADCRSASPDRELFAQIVGGSITRTKPTSWAEVAPLVARLEAQRPPLPTLAEANDALVDRVQGVIWFLIEARRRRPVISRSMEVQAA